MGFKTQPKYKLVRENILGKDEVWSKDEFELTEKQLLDLTYGTIDYEMIKVIIQWLKDAQKNAK